MRRPSSPTARASRCSRTTTTTASRRRRRPRRRTRRQRTPAGTCVRHGRPEGGNGAARRRDGGGDRRQEAPFRVKEHARTRRGVQHALCCLPPRAPAAPNRRGSRHAHGQRWACWVHVSVRRRGASAPALPARVGGSRTSPFFWAHLSLGRAARRVGTQPCTPRRTRAPGLNLWPRARAGRAEGRGSRGVRDRPPEGLLWPRQRRFGFSWAERAVECAMGRARPRSPAAVNGATDTNADAPFVVNECENMLLAWLGPCGCCTARTAHWCATPGEYGLRLGARFRPGDVLQGTILARACA